MKIEYTMKGTDVPYTVETAGPDQSYPWMAPGVVYDFDGASDEYGPAEFTPTQARVKAAALLRAADEAESGVSEEARLRAELAAVDDALREAGITYPLGARGVRDLGNLFKMAKDKDA
ncbi:hypothetical protein [Streptomyces sp. NPDC005907]|uniref:hypothetical protein n=1 Tax=Streptomyces sp. NPDC005907 TaxID=3154571 RepID=UPI0033EE31F2